MDGINRTDEDEKAAMARVHLVASNRSVRDIGASPLIGCSNLVKVTAPVVEEVGDGAFG